MIHKCNEGACPPDEVGCYVVIFCSEQSRLLIPPHCAAVILKLTAHDNHQHCVYTISTNCSMCITCCFTALTQKKNSAFFTFFFPPQHQCNKKECSVLSQICSAFGAFHFSKRGSTSFNTFNMAFHIRYMHSTWCLYLFLDNIYITCSLCNICRCGAISL